MFVLRRQAARVIVVDPEGRILLIRAHDPARPDEGSWWEIPGGGVEMGETSDAACLRELREEAGIADAEIEPSRWRQRCRFSFGGFRFDQVEDIHVARVTTADRPLATSLEALERLAFEDVRWWPIEELRAAAPRTIPTQLIDLLAELDTPVPDEPADITDEKTWTW